MYALFSVALGGGLGAMLRFFVSSKTNKHFIGTWMVNILGASLLAVFFRLYEAHTISMGTWLFWGVGFCGAFTTFSTFGSEMIQLLLAKQYRTALYYGATSFIISLLIVYFIVHI